MEKYEITLKPCKNGSIKLDKIRAEFAKLRANFIAHMQEIHEQREELSGVISAIKNEVEKLAQDSKKLENQ